MMAACPGCSPRWLRRTCRGCRWTGAGYWPAPPLPIAGEPAALGLSSAGHPLLGAAVQLAAGTGHVLTGRVSVQAQPWLADHAVGGVIVVPGTALLDLAIRAGDLAGCPAIAELVLEAPLILPAGQAVQIQVTVSAPGEDQSRAIAIWARPDTGDGPWTRHAAGRLTASPPAPAGRLAGPATWPPPGAVPAGITGLYDALAAAGYGYGPAFQGARAAWTRGPDVYAEITLPAGTPADGFAIHPALLDPALPPPPPPPPAPPPPPG